MRDEALNVSISHDLRIPSPGSAHYVFNIWILSQRRIIQHIALELGICLYIQLESCI